MGMEWQYCVHLLPLVTVTWFGDMIESQSTTTSTLQSTRSSIITSTRSLTTFINDVKPLCPPPGNLHLLCDVTLAANLLTCKERLTVLKFCLNKSTNGVNDSKWSECKSEDTCDIIVQFLIEIGYIIEQTTQVNISSSEKPNKTISQVVITTPSISRNITLSSSSTSSNITSTSISTSSSSSSNTSDTLMTSSSPSVSSHIADVTTISSAYITSSTTQAVFVIGGQTSGVTAFPPPLSFVYPLFGGICVLIEVIVLIWIFCCRKNKYGTPLNRQRKISEEPIQEEEIQPAMTSPTRALYSNTAFDEEEVMQEDEKIFKSYLNLRFIDDSSVECTPEKILIT